MKVAYVMIPGFKDPALLFLEYILEFYILLRYCNNSFMFGSFLDALFGGAGNSWIQRQR